MWLTQYEDYKKDDDTKKFQVDAGQGINGCEMHERFGWGEQDHPRKPTKGIVSALLSLFIRKKS